MVDSQTTGTIAIKFASKEMTYLLVTFEHFSLLLLKMTSYFVVNHTSKYTKTHNAFYPKKHIYVLINRPKWDTWAKL